MHTFKLHTTLLTIVFGLSLSAAQVFAEAYVLRFSDTPTIQGRILNGHEPFRFMSSESAPAAPATSAMDWLKRDGWKRIWPRFGMGEPAELSFAGPLAERYLRLEAPSAFYIWGRKVDIDPHQLPWLDISWSVEHFPREAALDIAKRNDRPIAIVISFGPKVPYRMFLPDIPRSLAFFWDETATVGRNYTCSPPRNGPANAKVHCKYPHVKYIALRSGKPGSRHTDRVNLVDQFKQHFPDYWAEHQRVPPITVISFEARSDRTESTSLSKLYALTFSSAGSPNSPAPVAQKGKTDGNR